MAVKIRLSRAGAKKTPHYRVIIADSRSPRDGRFLERVGTYNPLLPRDHQDRVKLKLDRTARNRTNTQSCSAPSVTINPGKN